MTGSQLSASPGQKASILILADSDHERNKWVGLLSELQRILRKHKLKERSVYAPKEAYDNTLPLIKGTQTATIIGDYFSLSISLSLTLSLSFSLSHSLALFLSLSLSLSQSLYSPFPLIF